MPGVLGFISPVVLDVRIHQNHPGGFLQQIADSTLKVSD